MHNTLLPCITACYNGGAFLWYLGEPYKNGVPNTLYLLWVCPCSVSSDAVNRYPNQMWCFSTDLLSCSIWRIWKTSIFFKFLQTALRAAPYCAGKSCLFLFWRSRADKRTGCHGCRLNWHSCRGNKKFISIPVSCQACKCQYVKVCFFFCLWILYSHLQSFEFHTP